jgi:hypothetical protein
MKFTLRLVTMSLALCSICSAAVYEEFPGFKELYARANFVGIVKLGSRDVPKDEDGAFSDWIGPHRFFEVTSVKILKGPKIQSQIARLADRRLEMDGKKISRAPSEEILLSEKQFLVFLTGSAVGPSDRYRWDELHAEGAVLPVSPKTNLETLDLTKPLEVCEQIVRDYTAHCKALYEHALVQERLLGTRSNQSSGQ